MARLAEIKLVVVVGGAAALGAVDAPHGPADASEATQLGGAVAGEASRMAGQAERTAWIVIARITIASVRSRIWRAKEGGVAFGTQNVRSPTSKAGVMATCTGLRASAVVVIPGNASAGEITQQLAIPASVAGLASIN